MKNNLFKLTIVLLIGLSLDPALGFTKKTREQKPSPTLQESESGFFLGGLLGSMSADISLSDDTNSLTTSSVRDTQYVGLRGGYFYFSDSNLGFLGQLDLAPKIAGTGWGNYVFLRPQANIAYQLDQAFFFAGLNINKFLSGFENYGMGLGWQIGAGFSFSREWIGEVQYITTKHSFSVDDINADVTFKSIEFSMSYRY